MKFFKKLSKLCIEVICMIRKTVIITGGFGDIGKATAIKFAKAGYNVAMTFFNSFDDELIQKIEALGVQAFCLHCDQRHESDVINFVNSCFNEFEYVDCLVTSAGKAETECFLYEKTAEEIDDILNINLRGTILFNREVSKRFLEQKHGNIINISSIYAATGGSLESVYSAAKGGVEALTKSLSVELAPIVRVNAVAPGIIDTKMNSNLTKDQINFARNQTPLGRLGTPKDVADAIYFLASDDASYITGEILTISGGAIRL